MKVVDAHFLESVPKSPYGGKSNEKARPKDPPRRPKSKRGIKRGPKKEMQGKVIRSRIQICNRIQLCCKIQFSSRMALVDKDKLGPRPF